MKYITIASDISCDADYKIVTWAFYIRHGGGVIKQSGQFKKYHQHTSTAETYALINALTIAKQQIPDFSDSRVIIHNEIERVLDIIRPNSLSALRKERNDAIQDIALPILESAYSYEIRKIKAHYKRWKSSDNPAKYAINRWCDREARKELQRLRKLKKKACAYTKKPI